MGTSDQLPCFLTDRGEWDLLDHQGFTKHLVREIQLHLAFLSNEPVNRMVHVMRVRGLLACSCPTSFGSDMQ